MIDLTAVRLTEARTWLHAFPLGTYQHPVHGALTFTRQRLERIASQVNTGVRGISLAIDYDHRQDVAKGGKAAGWIDYAEVRGDGLWLQVQLTAEAVAEVRAGAWRYLSPEFAPSWTDPRSGVEYTDVLLGAALTNRPFLRDLAPIAASETSIPGAVTGRPALVGMAFGAGSRGESTSTRPAPPRVDAGAVPTRLSEAAAALRFYEVIGRHLGAASFDQAMEQAAREDPAGYAAYRQSVYTDGRREGI